MKTMYNAQFDCTCDVQQNAMMMAFYPRISKVFSDVRVSAALGERNHKVMFNCYCRIGLVDYWPNTTQFFNLCEFLQAWIARKNSKIVMQIETDRKGNILPIISFSLPTK